MLVRRACPAGPVRAGGGVTVGVPGEDPAVNSSMPRAAVPALLRFAVLVAVTLGFHAVALASSAPDADIGLGVAWWLVVLALSTVWGLRDGYRATRDGAGTAGLLARWGAVAAAYAVVSAALKG